MWAIIIILVLAAISIFLIMLGGSLVGTGVFLLFLDVIGFILAIRIVRPNEVRTVEFLGKYKRILRRGFNLIIPFLETTRFQTLVRRTISLEIQAVSKDDILTNIKLDVIYYVEDDKDDTPNGAIYKSIYSVDDIRILIKSTIDLYFKAIIMGFGYREIFSNLPKIGEELEKILQEKIGFCGYTVDFVKITNINGTKIL